MNHLRFSAMFALFMLSLLATAGCNPPPPRNPGLAWKEPQIVDDMLYVGVSRVDVTPALHLSTFGHGPESRIATGVRTRLRCSAFVLAKRTPGLDPIALVPCDLQGISYTLHEKVAARVAHLGIKIPDKRIVLMATHTHAGPAHYFEAPFYSGPLSSTAPGFDPKVADYLARKISDAIATSYGNLEPACAGWKEAEASRLSFNRGYEPFLSNVPATPDEADFMARGSRVDKSQRAGDPDDASLFDPREEAVDRSVFAIRFDRRQPQATTCQSPLGATQVIGAFGVFGTHPTAVDNTNQLFHGDLFGFAARIVESCLVHRPTTPPPAGTVAAGAMQRTTDVTECERPPQHWLTTPIVGIANGIEGDVSPKTNVQAFDEARRLGRGLGRVLTNAIEDVVTRADFDFEMKFWELSFPAGIYDEHHHRLCPWAEIGVAAGGGARDGPTRLRIIPEANPGFRLRAKDAMHECHAEKLPLRASLFAGDNAQLPTQGPIALLKLGSGYIATAPGEMTTMTGRRVRAAVRTGLKLDPNAPIAVVGLTNAYLEYIATFDEYKHQAYEGASTIYGPHMSEFLVRHFGCLAESFHTSKSDRCTEQLPFDLRTPAPKPTIFAERWVDADEEFHMTSRAAPTVIRLDALGAVETVIQAMPPAYASDRGKFSVEIIEDGGGLVDDDQGASIEVREVRSDDGYRWRVRWLPDFGGGKTPDVRCNKHYRIVIVAGARLETDPFQVRCR